MGEKWADKAYPHGFGEEEGRRKKEQMESVPLPDLLGAEELEKNSFEIDVTSSAKEGLNAFLRELGVEEMDMDDERVHVIDEEEFGRAYGKPDVQGTAMYGHAYVIRNEDESRFVHDVTHELSHVVSYLALDATKITEGKNKGLSCTGVRKSGMIFSPESGRVTLYAGFNEAVTEMFAKQVRKHSLDSLPLGEQQKEDLVQSHVYIPQLEIVRRVLDEVAEDDAERDGLKKELFLDYLNGTYKVMKKIDRRRPGTSKILAEMGTNFDAARETGRQLGYDDFDEFVEKLKETLGE